MHPTNIVDTLRHYAHSRPDATAYSFLDEGEDVSATLSYAEIDLRAQAVAATLQQLTSPGDRVVLVFAPGLDFVIAFLGCLYAGVVAVPAPPPNMRRLEASLGRLASMIDDAAPSLLLTTGDLLPELRRATCGLAGFGGLRWQASDRFGVERAGLWRPTSIDRDSLSFLQYTSGSTSTPKGVMVSHANLMSNLAMVHATAAPLETYNIVSWLPLFHDMGLIGVVLHGLFLGTETRLMSPVTFLKRPIRWLRAIASLGDVFSGGPNFAFDLCVQRISADDKRGLDLSRWKVAFCGAETVRQRTLERFVEEFAGCGFDRRALLPCYGLAEATLVVSSRTPGRLYESRTVDPVALEQGEVKAAPEGAEEARDARPLTVVSCGRAKLDQEIAIVDPESLEVCGDGRVGEVWVRGSNVAFGYWRNHTRTRETFEARTAAGEGPYLRTGDLGFLVGGELYITGRIKEVIIVRGRCLYPQDIELLIDGLADTYPEVILGESVAFSLAGDEQERVGLFVRVKPRSGVTMDATGLTTAIQAVVLEAFDVSIADIALIRSPLPKTTSGKKTRGLCASMVERDGDALGGLEILHRTIVASPAREPLEDPRPSPSPSSSVSVEPCAELTRRVVDWLAEEQQLDPAKIQTQRPLADYGLDSLVAVSLIEFLEVELGTALGGAILSDSPSIEELVRRLAVEAKPRAQL